MKLSVLALDYDGTIAFHDRLHPHVRTSIAEARGRGIAVVLVTGRILSELRRQLPDLRLFDAVVAENGAVLLLPESGRSTQLGARAPARFLEALDASGIDYLAGESLVDIAADDAPRVLEILRALELPLVIQFNRSRAMVLPQSISKGTGIREALGALRLSAHNAIGIGDAENDHELLEACEIGVAVAWGSPMLQAAADEVLEGEGPEAVAGYIRRLTNQPQLGPAAGRRHRLLLGSRPDGTPLELSVRGRNVLVSGDPRSGKSWVAGLLAEQLVLQQYSVCIIDPEGDYWALEALPEVVLLGGDAPPPPPAELVRLLRHPGVSPIVDLSHLPQSAKREYVGSLLATLHATRRHRGLPHRILLDEAHYFLQKPDPATLLDLEHGGYTLISYRASGIHPRALESCEVIVVTRESDLEDVATLARVNGDPAAVETWAPLFSELMIDEACLLPNADEAHGEPVRFKIAPRLTPHVRHRHKYLDVPVVASRAFVFTGIAGESPPHARTLKEFANVLLSAESAQLDGHLRRADFSRWIDDVFGDHALAARVRELERQYQLGRMRDIRDALATLIQERYPIGVA